MASILAVYTHRMLSLVVALAAIQSPVTPPDPAALISKMFAKYYEAKAVSGKITMTQAAGGHTAKVFTALQYEEPSKLYIRQDVSIPERKSLLVVSNGTTFSYDLPRHLQLFSEQHKRLAEAVKTDRGALSVAQIFTVCKQTLQDVSPPLRIAIGRMEDLRLFRDQWATVEIQGDEKIGGKAAFTIGGDWREYREAPISAKYQIAITADGDLLQFAQRETVQPDPSVPAHEVITVWTAELETNPKLDPLLFKLPES